MVVQKDIVTRIVDKDIIIEFLSFNSLDWLLEAQLRVARGKVY